MNNLYKQADVEGILERLEKLTPDAQRLWGKMNVNQMLAHCNVAIETAMGRNFPKRILIGRLIGSFIKPGVLSERHLAKNSPTDKNYIIPDNREFEVEKVKATALIKQFSEDGPAKCTTHSHPFFGQFTPEEWAILQWKHFDHHLRQFGA